MSVLLSLGSAITYGVADFSGALASRQAPPIAVTASAQLVGAALMPLFLLAFPAPFSAVGLVAGVGAGLFGGLGLLLYFTGLRDGAMGVVSPLSSVSAAGVPLTIGLLSGERPAALAVLGVAVALPGIWLAALPARPPGRVRRAAGDGPLPPGVLLGLASGLAFGMFFVLLDLAPADSGAWPLLGSKVGSVALVLALAAARRVRPLPDRGVAGLVLLSGALDVSANLLFLLATREGLLSLVSVITSQYPAVVVVLSVVVAGERLARRQGVGVGLALVAVGLISVA